MRNRLLLGLLAALALTAACRSAFPPFGEPPGTTPWARPGNPKQLADSTRSLMEKRIVADKRSPDVLLDTYLWWCTVPQSQWSQTRVGDSVRCLWHPPRI